MLSFFPRDVLDEILNLIESVSEDFPSYSLTYALVNFDAIISHLIVSYLRHLIVYVPNIFLGIVDVRT